MYCIFQDISHEWLKLKAFLGNDSFIVLGWADGESVVFVMSNMVERLFYQTWSMMVNLPVYLRLTFNQLM